MISKTVVCGIGCAALALSACAALEPAEPQAAMASVAADQAFEQLSQRYLEAMIELDPVYATSLGDHSQDGKITDVSSAGRLARTQTLKTFLAALKTIEKARLTRENQVDYALLKNAIEYGLWRQEVERPWAWNPQYYHNIASYALYGLVSRDFAPFAERAPNIVSRMNALPAMLATARAQIDPVLVPKVHAETVAKQNAGIMGLVDGVIAPEFDKAGVDRSAFDAARARLAKAMDEHQQWLDTVVVPQAKGEFRLGPEKYEAKMRFALQSELSRDQLKARASEAYAQTRAQMFEIAQTIGGCGAIEARDAARREQAVIECALEASYRNRASREGLMDAARATLAQASAFTAERGFVRMPDGPVEIITMPEFAQGNSVAYLDAPPPLERHLPAYYAISPIPKSWSDEQAESFLKEYNISMLHLLSIHEGVPGHYLQLDHANKFPGTLRAVLSSGPFIEGWAVYSERVMAEEGYLGGMETLEGRYFLLNGLKFRLRAIINTLLDIGIHTEGMTREDAMDLMMRGGFQQEREAAGKWVRANLSSIQLLSYFIGYSEHLALRREAEQRWGDQFTMRRYHDAVLAHGSPPVKYARALIFDLPVE